MRDILANHADYSELWVGANRRPDRNGAAGDIGRVSIPQELAAQTEACASVTSLETGS
jgi:hypothetical protein